MAFLIFDRVIQGNAAILRPTGQGFSLAGYNLVYHAWETRGHPTDQGWEVSADELVRLATNGSHTTATRRLIIDFDPKAKRRIGLIELLHIYAYTYQGREPGTVDWTPLMLKMRDFFDEEYEHSISTEEKAKRISAVPERADAPECVEFLYLNGTQKGWTWGRNGSTNAAFIEIAARDYFRSFF